MHTAVLYWCAWSYTNYIPIRLPGKSVCYQRKKQSLCNGSQPSAEQYGKLPGVDRSFLQAARNIKFAIARLDVKSEQSLDNAEIQNLAKEKAKYEISLSALQKNLEQNNRFFQLKYHEHFEAPAALQQNSMTSRRFLAFTFLMPPCMSLLSPNVLLAT